MSIREIPIRSLGELVDHVTPAEPHPVIGRRRDTSVYRGAFDAARPLLTSLNRLGRSPQSRGKTELEAHVFRSFIRYSRPHLTAQPVNEWELLVTAQHHGVPTRLLDWTYSPLVAAFFATRPDPREVRGDRAVWRLDWHRVHQAFGFPKLALLIEDLNELFGEQGSPFTPWRLFEWDGERDAFACMIEPPSLNPRIVAQAAVFTLCSDRVTPFDRFLEDSGLGEALTRFIIPAEHVASIRDQLDLVGIDERRLFPDLPGLAAMIRRYYS